MSAAGHGGMAAGGQSPGDGCGKAAPARIYQAISRVLPHSLEAESVGWAGLPTQFSSGGRESMVGGL